MRLELLANLGRAIVYDGRGCWSARPERYTTNMHEQADDTAALMDALAAARAILMGRSYGGAIALDVALRYSDRVRALVQLEGDGGLSLSEMAMQQLAELEKKIFAAAEVDLESVAETMVSAVAGRDAWGALPEEARQILTANGPAIVAELRGGYPEVTVAQFASVDRPTLLVGGKDSLLDYSEVMSIVSTAMPSAEGRVGRGRPSGRPGTPGRARLRGGGAGALARDPCARQTNSGERTHRPEEKHGRCEAYGRVHRCDADLHAHRERHRGGGRDHALQRVGREDLLRPRPSRNRDGGRQAVQHDDE